MNNHCYCVIMAGGIGSRFWPISRERKPKQFLSFSYSGETFLRQAYDRFSRVIPKENIYVISLARYKGLVSEYLPELSKENLILEPYNRNTAPCLAYATYTILEKDPEAVLVATPADHIISGIEYFDKALTDSIEYASSHRALITMGIKPERTDSNFGYIQAVGGADALDKDSPVKIKTFTEKPDSQLAEVFIKTGEFLWNSGIYVARAEVLRQEMEKYIPEITNLFKDLGKVIGTPEERKFIEVAYGDMERISIDYGVMEKTDISWMYTAKFQWADIGNWETMYHYLSSKDTEGNVVRAGTKLLQNTKDCIIYSSNENKLVVLKDLENYVVVDTEDTLMICPRDDKKLKEITTHIGLPEYENYR